MEKNRIKRYIADIYRPDAKIGGFLSALVLSGIAMGLYKGVQDNFLAEIVRIDAFGRGITEFFRELPGLFLIVILAWMYRFSEIRIFKIGLGLVLAGIAGLSLAGLLPVEFFPGMAGKVMVVALMVLLSAGEHIIMPVRSSISLHLAKENRGGASLGITGALGHGGNIAGFLIVTVIFYIFSRLGFAKLPQFRIVFAASHSLCSPPFSRPCPYRTAAKKRDEGVFISLKNFTNTICWKFSTARANRFSLPSPPMCLS